MDLALGVSVGSSMQIALLVTPIMVIIGWGINVDMSLFFNIYETAVLFASVVMVNYLIMASVFVACTIETYLTFFSDRVGRVIGLEDLCCVLSM